MLALYFSSVNLISFVQLLPFHGQSFDGQSVHGVGPFARDETEVNFHSPTVAPAGESRWRYLKYTGQTQC